jgi:methylenetetrahydrofolate dehydrogenase (NADP+)/methenyltetrahydrofolate cyclohydrolase
MTAQRIDGNALSQKLRAEVTLRTTALKAKGITPGLAVILVGENPASQVYVRNKVKACHDSGLTQAFTASWYNCPYQSTLMHKK